MRDLKNGILALIVSVLVVGCSDGGVSEEPDEIKKIANNSPSFSRVEQSEVFYSDAQPLTSTKIFHFVQGKVSKVEDLQSYEAIPGEMVESHRLTDITYGDGVVVVEDGFGGNFTYLLNSEGYAESCILKESGLVRTYTFAYIVENSGAHYLQKVVESINGVEYSSVEIDYSDRDRLRVTHEVDGVKSTFIMTYIPNVKTLENLSELPSIFLLELYPLSFHTVAIYGQILGNPFDKLYTQVYSENNNPNNSEITTYSYILDKRALATSCNVKNVVTSISQSGNQSTRIFKRTIDYSIR